MMVLGFLAGAVDGAVRGGGMGGMVCGPQCAVVGAGAGVLVEGVTGAQLAGIAAEASWDASMRRDDNGNGGSERQSSAGRMQREVDRGQAPRSVRRVDRARAYREQDNVHFKSGDTLNRDGTWKHGGRDLTNGEKEWLSGHGWSLPR
jgi:hypothetical protein